MQRSSCQKRPGNSSLLAAILLAFFACSDALGGTIHLTFTDNSDNEVGFDVERRIQTEDTPAEFEVIGTLYPSDPEAVGVQRDYYDREALAGVVYEYRVNAHNEYGYSGYTNVASGQVRGGPKTPGTLELKPVPVLKYVRDVNGNLTTQAAD